MPPKKKSLQKKNSKSSNGSASNRGRKSPGSPTAKKSPGSLARKKIEYRPRSKSPGALKDRRPRSKSPGALAHKKPEKAPLRPRSKSPGSLHKRKLAAGNKKSSTKQQSSYYTNLGKQAKKSPNNARQALDAIAPAMSLRSQMESMSLGKPLHGGIQVTKVSRTGKSATRMLTLSKDQSCIFLTHGKVSDDTVVAKLPVPIWTPSKGWNGDYMRYIDVAELDAWQSGVISTQILEQTLGNRTDKINQIITIFHHDAARGRRSLNMFVDKPENLMVLRIALDVMKKNYMDQQQWVGRLNVLLRFIWYDIDKDKNKTISLEEFSQICERVNLYVSGISKQYKEFVKANKPKGKELSYTDTFKLLQQLQKSTRDYKPSPGMEIWKTIFGKGVDSVPASIFYKKFLSTVQGERTSCAEEDAKSLIQAMNALEIDVESIPTNSLKLNKARFEEFLQSPWNDAYDPVKQQAPSGPLTKPISEYWINTSHNTYLLGDQLRSKSSVEAYTEALLRGCKCLELDCWDGHERKGEHIPVIYHGHTLTSKIEFRPVILLVAKYLQDNPNSYPIILSLENHCSHPYQQSMASCMKELFGKSLFIPNTSHRSKELPSPEELKGMCVIKGKRPPEADEGDNDNDDSAEQNNGTKEDDPYSDLFAKFDQELPPNSQRPSTFVPPSGNFAGESGDVSSSKKKKRKSDDDNDKLPKYAKELLEITLFHGRKFSFFEDSIENLPSHMHSIGETKISKIATKYENNPALWREYNTDHMTRTYPAGKRIDSSNYNPVFAWSMGCQMVALNFQTHDANLALNDGRFRQHGKCGYVPKPKSLLRGGEKPPAQKLHIKVISGSCLPKPNGEKTGEAIDPYVKVELHDVRINTRFREQFYVSGKGTKSVDNNGLCPVWNDAGKEFTVESPDVAMVLFQVLDEDVGRDDMIASAAIPVSCLRKGYRSIQLYDKRNSRLGPFLAATLLVQIKLNTVKQQKD